MHGISTNWNATILPDASPAGPTATDQPDGTGFRLSSCHNKTTQGAPHAKTACPATDPQ
ncbi:hypothetical protein IMCC9480_3720 [Oxalobacteraceae bacterium IMCC9480]|nr:hypothetical protein IMCC9480_3720 [Oxalobacteraceae bacterium IMCC9480]